MKKVLPKIYRFISEKQTWLYAITALALVCIVLLSIEIQNSLQTLKAVQAQRAQIQAQITQALQLSQKYPGDRDIYVRLASLEYQLGNWNKAGEYNSQALALAPNFLPALKLKALLVGK